MSSQLIYLEHFSDWIGCVMAYGHFSTIHPGHIRYLRHAKNLGKPLIIALIGDDDGCNYPFNQKERAEALSLLGIADAVLQLKSDELSKALEKLKPSILVLGNEYKERAGIQTIIKQQQKIGGTVQFHAGDVKYANADLLGSSEGLVKQRRRHMYREACERQGLTVSDLINSMESWSKCRLIVIGDTIVDQYAACEAIGMSAEAPVVVVKELARKNFIGAAAVVAAHIRALGANCKLISVVGEDIEAEEVRMELARLGIGDGIVKDPSRPTTFKKRYLVESQKLFRVSRLEQHSIDRDVEEKVIALLERHAPDCDGIVVSDFVYGVITPKVTAKVKELSKRYDLRLFGDLQCSSQVGSVSKFSEFSLLCPNERELRLALQSMDRGLESLSQELLETTRCERLLVKLAGDGFIAYDRCEDGDRRTQPFPALSVNPVDVAGAGDSVLAVMATGLSADEPMMKTAALACCMAAIAVETMGNTPISKQRLSEYVSEVLGG